MGFILLVVGAQVVVGLVALRMNLKGRRSRFSIGLGILTGLLTLCAGGWVIPKMIESTEGSYLDVPFIPEEGPIPMLLVGVGILELSVAGWALWRKPVPHPQAGPFKHQ